MRGSSERTAGAMTALPGSKKPSPLMVTTERSAKSCTCTRPAAISGCRKVAKRGAGAAGGGGGGAVLTLAALASRPARVAKAGAARSARLKRSAASTPPMSSAASVATTHSGRPSRSRTAACFSPCQRGDSALSTAGRPLRSNCTRRSRTLSSWARPLSSTR